MEKKNYKIEVLFDNGVIESYDTGEVTEEELINVMNVPYESFANGLNAVLQVPNGIEHTVLINLIKVTRISAFPYIKK